jgi:uncharacterized protein DUF5713
MNVKNPSIKEYEFLPGMYADGYFPRFLVDKLKEVLVKLCEDIESESPPDTESLLKLTHAATERINELAEEFDENGSDLETVAREVIADDFEHIVRTYGFNDVDIEEVIAPREW